MLPPTVTIPMVGHLGSPTDSAARAQLAVLRARVRQERALRVAFSGGADSALGRDVAAEELGPTAVAVTAVSTSLPDAERRAEPPARSPESRDPVHGGVHRRARPTRVLCTSACTTRWCRWASSRARRSRWAPTSTTSRWRASGFRPGDLERAAAMRVELDLALPVRVARAVADCRGPPLRQPAGVTPRPTSAA